jgi:hypothetical protein
MREKSTPINFTVDSLEKSLKQKRVTATIRSISYIKKYDLKIGKKVEIKYKRNRIGFAIIKDIRPIVYDDLHNQDIVNKLGFDTTKELIDSLKDFWKWRWNEIKLGKQKMRLIEFEWI